MACRAGAAAPRRLAAAPGRGRAAPAMEFPFVVDGLGGGDALVSRWTAADMRRLDVHDRQRLAQVIAAMGRGSARAQGLQGPITDPHKLAARPDQRLYLAARVVHDDERGAWTHVLGLIKFGRKRLFIYGDTGAMHEIEPVCVLDFFVHPSVQRGGIGRMLYDHGLADHPSERPHTLGYDRPSPKFIAFLAKHFGLRKYVPQVNNFVVFNKYFDRDAQESPRRPAEVAPSPPRTPPPRRLRPRSGRRRREAQAHARAFADDQDRPYPQPRATARADATARPRTRERAQLDGRVQGDALAPERVSGTVAPPASKGTHAQLRHLKQAHSHAPSAHAPQDGVYGGRGAHARAGFLHYEGGGRYGVGAPGGGPKRQAEELRSPPKGAMDAYVPPEAPWNATMAAHSHQLEHHKHQLRYQQNYGQLLRQHQDQYQQKYRHHLSQQQLKQQLHHQPHWQPQPHNVGYSDHDYSRRFQHAQPAGSSGRVALGATDGRTRVDNATQPRSQLAPHPRLPPPHAWEARRFGRRAQSPVSENASARQQTRACA